MCNNKDVLRNGDYAFAIVGFSSSTNSFRRKFRYTVTGELLPFIPGYLRHIFIKNFLKIMWF